MTTKNKGTAALTEIKSDFFEKFGHWLTLVIEERDRDSKIAMDQRFKFHLDFSIEEAMQCRDKSHRDEDRAVYYHLILERLIFISNYAKVRGWSTIAEGAAVLTKKVSAIMAHIAEEEEIYASGN